MDIDPADFFEGIGQKLSKFKLPDLKTLGIAGAVLLVVAGLAWLFSRQSLETRCQVMADAIAKGDMQTIVGLSLPGTELDAIKWSADINKEYSDLKLRMGGVDPGVKIQIQHNSGGTTAQALVVFTREGGRRSGQIPIEDLPPIPTRANVKQSLETVLHWSLDTWGNWRLDARKTSESASPSS
jgi:hypothetical protein